MDSFFWGGGILLNLIDDSDRFLVMVDVVAVAELTVANCCAYWCGQCFCFELYRGFRLFKAIDACYLKMVLRPKHVANKV
jgi:hypothetical protein